MSYIGQGLPADTFQGFVTDSFTGDGSATTFTLSKEPFSEDTLIVVINNVIQKPTTNFTVSGTTLTIVGTAVASGDVIYAIHMGGPLPIGGAAELDLNGASDKLILDADGDSTISADTDDQIDFKLGGTDALRVTGTALTGNAVATIGAAGTASSIAGLPIYVDSSSNSVYTHDVSGTDDSADNNTAFGLNAADAITTADSITVFGRSAGSAITTGSSSTFFGKEAGLAVTEGTNNIFMGVNAGHDVTTGGSNIAIGSTAYDGCDTENHNLAIGRDALGGSVAGGEYNVAVGNYALDATTSGDNNTAVGYQALSTHTTGVSNTAVGYQAMSAGNITGNYNTAIGVQASNNATSGQNNTSLGYSAANDAVYSLTNESHRIVIGNNSNTDAYIKIDWTVTSDARDKMNFEDVPHGLDFVNQLTPIKFHFKKSRDDETPHGKARYGFKAQDILALEGDNPVIIDAENPEALKYKGEHLVPVLVNAVKELSAKVKALEDA